MVPGECIQMKINFEPHCKPYIKTNSGWIMYLNVHLKILSNNMDKHFNDRSGDSLIGF